MDYTDLDREPVFHKAQCSLSRMRKKKKIFQIFTKEHEHFVYASHHRTPEAFVGHKTVMKMNDLLWQSLISMCSVCQWQAMVDPQSICCYLLSIQTPRLHVFKS